MRCDCGHPFDRQDGLCHNPLHLHDGTILEPLDDDPFELGRQHARNGVSDFYRRQLPLDIRAAYMRGRFVEAADRRRERMRKT